MLSPYRVLDLTDFRGEIGPMILGDMGADVLRIEPPTGSSARSCAPHFEGASDDLTSLQFIAFNRNKRSIALDPDSAEDRDTLQALIRSADFVFESAPERELESFGIDFEELKEMIKNQTFYQLQVGRYYVALSLQEAESLREELRAAQAAAASRPLGAHWVDGALRPHAPIPIIGGGKST